jgi:glycosyltransferase involved in cell wall biosynthesis
VSPFPKRNVALNEAMACCRPVIASDTVGAAVDLIDPDRNGWVVPSGDIKALQNVLAAAAGMNRDGLRNLGEHSARIIKDWSIPRQVEAIVTCLRRVAGRPVERSQRVAA